MFTLTLKFQKEYYLNVVFIKFNLLFGDFSCITLKFPIETYDFYVALHLFISQYTFKLHSFNDFVNLFYKNPINKTHKCWDLILWTGHLLCVGCTSISDDQHPSSRIGLNTWWSLCQWWALEKSSSLSPLPRQQHRPTDGQCRHHHYILSLVAAFAFCQDHKLDGDRVGRKK